MPETSKLGISVGVMLALVLVLFGVVAASRGPSSAASSVQGPHLTSMDAAAQAMRQAGEPMKAHGQAMLDEGKKAADQDLIAHGEHWLRDADALIQGGEWMSDNPTAPQSLHSSRSDLQAQGSWSELNRRTQAMLHDPSRAGALDLEALSADGEAMQAEGRNMAEHGRVMAEEAEVMVARHALQGQAASDLRATAQTMREVGGHLSANGQEMVDYAGRLKRSMGYR